MISVVVPTLNEERFVGVLFESLAAQVISEPLEIIVADNRSTDRTREVVNAFKGRFGRLTIVDGGRPAVGRNAGALSGSGDPIFFVDADLELRDSHFLVENVNDFRKRDLAAATVRLSPLSGLWCDHVLASLYNRMLLPASALIRRPLGAMCIAAARSVFDVVGGYPEDVAISEDHDFVQRCAKVGPYGILPIRAHFSVRRLEREGRIPLCLKYVKASYLRTFRGPIREFDYEFGCFGNQGDLERSERSHSDPG